MKSYDIFLLFVLFCQLLLDYAATTMGIGPVLDPTGCNFSGPWKWHWKLACGLPTILELTLAITIDLVFFGRIFQANVTPVMGFVRSMQLINGFQWSQHVSDGLKEPTYRTGRLCKLESWMVRGQKALVLPALLPRMPTAQWFACENSLKFWRGHRMRMTCL